MSGQSNADNASAPPCYGTHPNDPAAPVPPTDPCWAWLRREFPQNAQGKLPKVKRSAGDEVYCETCGQRHALGARAFHADYIGHAFLRERLNEVAWSWTPSSTPDTGPMVIQENDSGLVWLPFTMTVMGVTHPEVACADTGKEEWPKLLWSDAITRGAMAHGIALHLWQKDMPVDRDEPRTRTSRARRDPTADEAAQRDRVTAAVHAARLIVEQLQGPEIDAWNAYKAEAGFDPVRTTATAAEAALGWLRHHYGHLEITDDPQPGDNAGDDQSPPEG